MRKRRLLLATAALATGIACKPRVVHGNTKHPTYPDDAGVGSGSGSGSGSVIMDAGAGSAVEVPTPGPDVIHANTKSSLYDHGTKK